MPNWTYNTITTKNPKILPQLIDDGGNFDFNKLIPMPESLNIESGSTTDEAIIYYLTDRLTKPAEEPLTSLLVRNSFDKDWSNTVIQRLKNWIGAGQYNAEKQDTLYNMGEQYVNNYKQYGFLTWYEWSIANWGTKWNACDTVFEPENPTEVSFSTAWAAPEPIFESLCEKFPDDVIKIRSEYEEGFITEYENDDGSLITTAELETEGYDEDGECAEGEEDGDEE